MTKDRIGRRRVQRPSAQGDARGLGFSIRCLALTAVLVAALTGCSEGVDPIPGYVEGLRSADRAEQEKAISALARLGADGVEAVAPIVAGSTDVRTITGAIRVLAMNSSIESLQMVEARLKDADPDIRKAAIDGVAALARVSKRRSTEDLRAAFSDENPRCIRAAARGLAALNVEEATAVLEKGVESGTGPEVVFAAEGLYRLDGRPEALKLIVESLRPGVEEARQEAAAEVVADAQEGGGEQLRLKFVGPLVELLLREGEAPAAEKALDKVRDDLIEELGRPQIPKYIRQYITALGQIADPPSCERLLDIFEDTGKDIVARLVSADALGQAAMSPRLARMAPDMPATIAASLKKMLTREADIRVQIASAISLCRMRERAGVDFLLRQLVKIDRERRHEVATEDLDPAKQQELTALRVRAQEALTSSGDFVVADLRRALDDPEAGDITRWAAITTLGELRVPEARPRLIEMLTAIVPAGDVKPAPGDSPAEFVLFERPQGPLQVDTNRAALLTVALGSERAPVPARGKYVRQAAAEALGRIGGEGAAEALAGARRSHEALRDRLQACLDQRSYARLVPKEPLAAAKKREARKLLRELCERILEEQADVLFYIRKAQATLREEGRGDASH